MIRLATATLLLLALLMGSSTAIAAEPKPRDARIGGTLASFEKKYGAPTSAELLGAPVDANAADATEIETDAEPAPEINIATYAIDDFARFSATLYKEKLIGAVFYAHDPEALEDDAAITDPNDANWDQKKATRYAERFLPRDVDCDDDPIEFNDESLSFACTSEDMVKAFNSTTLAALEVIGAKGEVSYRLHLDTDGDVYAVELALGNGTRPYDGDGTIPEERQPFAPTHIVIPSIGVDATIENTPIIDGVMGVPQDVWAVGWYNQLAQPGDGGNVVMAAHVDWYGVGPVVFANLSSIAEGAMVYVTNPDGAGATYRVTSIRSVPWDYPAQEIVDRTGTASITLITCTGSFTGGQYDQRLIVRADRI
jgi:LPXTG-site transpeptidase (sortase) family protein